MHIVIYKQQTAREHKMMLSHRNFSAPTRTNWVLLLIGTLLSIVVTCAGQNDTDHADSIEMIAKNETEEITDLEMKEVPYTSVWEMMYDFWSWMISGYGGESKFAVGEPRTFGKLKRLQMSLIPIVFKFGIISAMITVLVFLALKTVFLLKLLLLLNAGAIFAKILTYKADHYQQQHQPSWAGYNGWSTAPAVTPNNWPGAPPLNKEIHLHIHGGNQQHQGWDKSDYSGYSSSGRYFDAANELDNPGPLPYLRSTYPNHHNIYTNALNGGR